MNKLFNKWWILLICGLLCACVAALLAYFGNPKNMAICIACFIRDTAGAMKFHNASAVQYVRPEIIGIILGSFIIALVTKEFKSTGGSSPLIRFALGLIMMIGALVFLGCPLRMVIRMAGGDLNAYIALIGFILGIGTGIIALKRGFSLGEAKELNKTNGFVMPGFVLAILIAFIAVPFLFAFSESGPGSMHAPLALSLVCALVFGAIAQKTRMCFAGSFRNVFMAKDFTLISTIGGLFVGLLIYNLVTGNFKLSMDGQPVAHQQVLWNILGMYVVGFGAVLGGGCPIRQLVLAGQGSSDGAITVLGMFVGAALCHNFSLASAGDAVDAATGAVTLGGVTPNGQIAIVICIVALFLIAFVGNKRAKSKKVKAV